LNKKITRRGFLNYTALASFSGLCTLCTNSEQKKVKRATTTYQSTTTDTAKSIAHYNDSPLLRERVVRGELAPVIERLPKNPFIRNVQTIGNYGGTLYDQSESQGGRFHLDGALVAGPQETNNDGIIIRPHLCDEVTINDDYSEFIFHIREGLKWSDGVELTSDDIIWWWQYEQNNKDLYPEGPRTVWKVGDEFAQFSKIDKLTFKIAFASPFRPCLNVTAHEWASFGSYFGQPSHWMKQFHIDFNPHADELARQYGYQKWYQLYKEREELMRGGHTGKPHVGPWTRMVSETTHEIYERNPYYAEIDQAGNQLPYIDRIYVSIVEDRKLRDARTATGAVSQGMAIVSQAFIYKENMKHGDYHLKRWQLANGSECMFAFNLNHKNPVKSNIYNDLRFRQAMSLAINRKRINQTLYFGLAKEYQATLNPSVSFFDPSWLTYCAEHDIDKANALLDEMGLEWDGRQAYRLQPDGQRLVTVLIFNRQTFPVEMLELVRKDWQRVGMETIIKETDFRFRQEKCRSADHDCTCWNADLVEEIAAYLPWASKWNPHRALYYAIDWWYWYYTGGKAGQRPPDEWIEQFNRMAAWYQAKNDLEYQKLGHAVWDFFSKQLVCIGTVAYAPQPVVIKNGLKNVKESLKMGYGTVWAKSYDVQTYYWDQPEKHR
jgi:peptide/nickel transport system substrate-binding protein